MNGSSDFDFDFDFYGTRREDLLADASRTVGALNSLLGGKGKAPAATEEAASFLLQQLNGEVAEFSAFPEVLRLEKNHFVQHGLPVPIGFAELSRRYKFYWIRFPITLYPADMMHFSKLKCAVEFNPGVQEGHLRPTAQMILPDRKFKQLLELSDSLTVRIGESFEFEAVSDLPVDVDVKAAGKLGLIVGPFKYQLKRAQLDHSPSGTEKVFWTMDGAEFFQEDDPNLIVVLRVPFEVDRVQVAGALQAYHTFSILSATLGETIRFFSKRLAEFFSKGAPLQDSKEWDITPTL